MGKIFRIGETVTGGIVVVNTITNTGSDEVVMLAIEFRDWDTNKLVCSKTINEYEFNKLQDFMLDNMDDFHMEIVMEYIKQLNFLK